MRILELFSRALDYILERLYYNKLLDRFLGPPKYITEDQLANIIERILMEELVQRAYIEGKSVEEYKKTWRGLDQEELVRRVSKRIGRWRLVNG